MTDLGHVYESRFKVSMSTLIVSMRTYVSRSKARVETQVVGINRVLDWTVTFAVSHLSEMEVNCNE